MADMNFEPWCLRYFTYKHLPEGPLRHCSAEFAELAHNILRHASSIPKSGRGVLLGSFQYWLMEFTPKNPESEEALAKVERLYPYLEHWKQLTRTEVEEAFRILLEAKDCAVRSLLEVSND